MLEATMIILDNSEWMRNGDYTPTRLQAQNDAVQVIFTAKTQSNQESSVGIMTMAGESPQVMVTLTNDRGKILNALHETKIKGKPKLLNGLQIAQLALKHRQNKLQKQRIILFIASPLDETVEELSDFGKKLKKNNVAIDIINFGQENENIAKLEGLLSSVNNNNSVPPGPNVLSDVVVSSPIIAGEGFSGGANYDDFGMDPNLDPELAMALRLSLEEEKARKEQDGSAPVPMETEDEELQKAVAMSMEESSSLNVNSLPGVDPNYPRIKNAFNKDKK